MTGRLVVCGVPIGNIGDASPRLREALAGADVIAAEDTRRLHTLCRMLEVPLTAKVVSYFEGNEVARTPSLVESVASGQVVVLVTDAGMPAVSDPGFRLVAATAEAGLPVVVVPGPSSVTTALALSGLPSDRWCFEGFLPRKAGERARRLAALAAEPRTIVLMEAPHRLASALGAMATAMGDHRPAVLCREMTKTYEEVVRSTLGGLVAWAEGRDVKGEVTLVVAGAPQGLGDTTAPADLARLVAEAEASGADRKSAIASVADAVGVRRREVFDAVVAAKGTNPGGPAPTPR